MDQQPIRNVIFTYLIEKGIKEFQVAHKGNRLYRTMAEDNSSSTAWDGICQLNTWEGYVDWRNKPALRGRHGGMLAACFVLAVEVLENLAYLANASNLVLYLSKFMHFSPSSSANIVTNFMGTAFLLALFGGSLADAFFTTYRIYVISAAIEFMGLLLLTVQAHTRSLKPPTCVLEDGIASCREVEGGKAVMLFAGLYLVALGVGGIKGSLAPHGAEQYDETTQLGRKQRSAFFNYYVFCLSSGALIAVTFVVLTAAIFNTCKSKNSSNAVTEVHSSPTCSNESRDEGNSNVKEKVPSQKPTEDIKFLNRALRNNPAYPIVQCTVKEVEEVKIVFKIFPIFMSTIMLNCCLAQLSTFSVQQAATMNTKLGSLKVPPASLPVFPVIFILILAPVYNHVIIPFARKVTKTEMGITHLQRIGTGLILSIVAMVVAALVEIKRKRVAVNSGLVNSSEPLPITFLWVALQYLFLGSADLFTLAGMMEFFFTDAPLSMRSLATSLSWASLAMGYYFSTVLVSIVNNITSTYRHTPWLFGSNLNHYHLERFYWLMCILGGLNFLHFLFWAARYKYRSTGP
ncbi:hypothetical protein WN943_013266 [Citrus x changshan-huyou]